MFYVRLESYSGKKTGKKDKITVYRAVSRGFHSLQARYEKEFKVLR